MEASPKPVTHLHLVDQDGVATEVCPDCAGYQRIITGLMRQRTLLEHQLADLQGTEPLADDVSQALSYWADRVTAEGWWHRRPSYKPADQRWTAARSRLKDGRTVDDLCLAVDGALLGDRNRVKREWVDAQSIFRNNENFERHLERALDPAQRWVRAVAEVPMSLRDRWVEVLDLADTCECQHGRIDHQREALTVDHLLTFGECLVHGCACDGFSKDWFRDERVARWMEGQT